MSQKQKTKDVHNGRGVRWWTEGRSLIVVDVFRDADCTGEPVATW